MWSVCWHIQTLENYPQVWKTNGGIMRIYRYILPNTSIYRHTKVYHSIYCISKVGSAYLCTICKITCHDFAYCKWGLHLFYLQILHIILHIYLHILRFTLCILGFYFTYSAYFWTCSAYKFAYFCIFCI